MNMGIGAEDYDNCQCLMNTWYRDYAGFDVDTTKYKLDRTYYQPIPPVQMVDPEPDFADISWDGELFSAWIAGDEAFKSAFPNWEDCAFWNRGKLFL